MRESILRALSEAESGNGTGQAEETFGLNKILTAKVSARVRFLDSLEPGPKPGLRASRNPVIDVFEEGNEVKVLVHLPGIKKEDIVLLAGPKSLRIEITKGDAKFRREIPCGANLTRARIRSSVENNSVVEIILHDGRVSDPH